MHWSYQTPSSNNIREDSMHGHHRIINTKIRLIIFFAVKDGEALYSQQKQADCGSDHELLIAKLKLIEENRENHQTIHIFPKSNPYRLYSGSEKYI